MEKTKSDALYYTHEKIRDAFSTPDSAEGRQAIMLNAIAHTLLDIAQQLEALRDQAS